MKKIVYVLTIDPKERCEMISSAFAQALTALSFGYQCEVFVLDNGIKMLQPEYIKGLKAESFNPLTELIQYYHDMGGKLYGCNPAIAARSIQTESCIGGIDGYVNATQLIESSVAADAVFTY